MPPYLAIGLFLLTVWLIFYSVRVDLRRKMLVVSFAVIPFAFYGYLSQPTYWSPETLFSLIIGIEEIISGFGLGGIGGVFYLVISGKRLKKRKTKHKTAIVWSIPLFIIFFSLSLNLLGIGIMYALILALVLGQLIIVSLRRDLLKAAVMSNLLFGSWYFVLFLVWFYFYPEVNGWWSYSQFWGIRIAGIPLGEVLFGFAFGGLWGVIYEFIFNYKLEKG